MDRITEDGMAGVARRGLGIGALDIVSHQRLRSRGSASDDLLLCPSRLASESRWIRIDRRYRPNRPPRRQGGDTSQSVKSDSSYTFGSVSHSMNQAITGCQQGNEILPCVEYLGIRHWRKFLDQILHHSLWSVSSGASLMICDLAFDQNLRG